jgi:hypothetical protein
MCSARGLSKNGSQPGNRWTFGFARYLEESIYALQIKLQDSTLPYENVGFVVWLDHTGFLFLPRQ